MDTFVKAVSFFKNMYFFTLLSATKIVKPNEKKATKAQRIHPPQSCSWEPVLTCQEDASRDKDTGEADTARSHTVYCTPKPKLPQLV